MEQTAEQLVVRQHERLSCRLPADVSLTDDSPTQRPGAPSVPTPFSEVTHLQPMLSLDNAFEREDVTDFVGRIRRDLKNTKRWLMWVVSDNVRKGAALNGIQIAEKIEAFWV